MKHRRAKCSGADSAKCDMVYLVDLGVLPRYYYQLGHTRFPRFSLGFLWKAAESLSQLGTVWSASLGVLPRYIWPRYIWHAGRKLDGDGGGGGARCPSAAHQVPVGKT